jgi:hypothetical protein
MRAVRTCALGALIVLGLADHAAADAHGDIRAMVQSYAGGEAFYYMLMTPFDGGRDRSDWGRGNVKALRKLMKAGFLQSYRAMPRACELGLNALRGSCRAKQTLAHFAFTRKALPYFGADSLAKVNVPGLTNARILIGRVKAYEIETIEETKSAGCEIAVVARKQIDESNEVGAVLVPGGIYRERLCFARKDGEYRLKRFHPVY